MEQRKVKREERLNHFLTLVSNKDPSVLLIQQEAEFLAAAVEPGKTASRKLEEGFGAYLYVASGEVLLNGHSFSQGDAAKIIEEPAVNVETIEDSELVMVVVRV